MMKNNELRVGDIISFNATNETRLVTFNGKNIGTINSAHNGFNLWFVSETIQKEGLRNIARKVDDQLANEVVVCKKQSDEYILKMRYKSQYARNFVNLARLVYAEIRLQEQDLPF